VSDSPTEAEWAERVPAALRVVDAILKGTLLPEPDLHEQETLGLADFDPELRYRVARDTLEQHYGKPKQQVQVDGGFAPLTLIFPDHVPHDTFDGELVTQDGLQLGSGDAEAGE